MKLETAEKFISKKKKLILSSTNYALRRPRSQLKLEVSFFLLFTERILKYFDLASFEF